MRKIFILSFILFSGFTLAIANPRTFPSYNNGHNNQPSGSTNSPSSSNYSSPSNNYNNHHHGSYNNNNHQNSNNYSNNHHGNYQPYKPKPIIVNPRPVIVSRPVYVSRPVIQVNLPKPNYNNYSVPNYLGFNFKDFIYTLRNQNYDSDKLSIARQALNNNYFDTYQIREVMSTMNFEKNRVEFAKDAYSNCVDKQNYFRVNDAFEFSSSIQELEDYIFVRR